MSVCVAEKSQCAEFICPADAFLSVDRPGYEHHRNVGSVRIRFQPATDFKAIDIGQMDVEHDRLGAKFGVPQCGTAIERLPDLEPNGLGQSCYGITMRMIIIDGEQ